MYEGQEDEELGPDAGAAAHHLLLLLLVAVVHTPAHLPAKHNMIVFLNAWNLVTLSIDLSESLKTFFFSAIFQISLWNLTIFKARIYKHLVENI